MREKYKFQVIFYASYANLHANNHLEVCTKNSIAQAIDVNLVYI